MLSAQKDASEDLPGVGSCPLVMFPGGGTKLYNNKAAHGLLGQKDTFMFQHVLKGENETYVHCFLHKILGRSKSEQAQADRTKREIGR